jgi:hypothetical protein
MFGWVQNLETVSRGPGDQTGFICRIANCAWNATSDSLPLKAEVYLTLRSCLLMFRLSGSGVEIYTGQVCAKTCLLQCRVFLLTKFKVALVTWLGSAPGTGMSLRS